MGMIYLFLIIILLFSVIIHEISHGYAAYALGDPTPKYDKRLTLNPINHLDPIGSILVPGVLLVFRLVTGTGFIFGWAKPVRFNPNNLRDKKYGELKVALAGPLSNILIALVFGLILRFVPLDYNFAVILDLIVSLNLLLAVFNLMPIYPLDGFHVLSTFISEERKVVLMRYNLIFMFVFFFFLFPFVSKFVGFLYSLIVGY
jgi:Zn-dependent protease